ncbi:MAG: rubredoxin, partial [Proteobacteria bacterium]|nr:rubredoxin [Pseudomonadota bacterium]
MKVWQCSVCKYVHKGDAPPEKCPVCGVDSSKFIEIDEASIPAKSPRKKGGSEEKTTSPVPKAASARTVYEQINAALLKHHAHPISVHTPNGVLPIAVILFVLAWFFDSQLFV